MKHPNQITCDQSIYHEHSIILGKSHTWSNVNNFTKFSRTGGGGGGVGR